VRHHAPPWPNIQHDQYFLITHGTRIVMLYKSLAVPSKGLKGTWTCRNLDYGILRSLDFDLVQVFESEFHYAQENLYPARSTLKLWTDNWARLSMAPQLLALTSAAHFTATTCIYTSSLQCFLKPISQWLRPTLSPQSFVVIITSMFRIRRTPSISCRSFAKACAVCQRAAFGAR
jgi:hypothetical protein